MDNREKAYEIVRKKYKGYRIPLSFISEGRYVFCVQPDVEEYLMHDQPCMYEAFDVDTLEKRYYIPYEHNVDDEDSYVYYEDKNKLELESQRRIEAGKYVKAWHKQHKDIALTPDVMKRKFKEWYDSH